MLPTLPRIEANASAHAGNKARTTNPKPTGRRIVLASILSKANGSTSALNPSGTASTCKTAGTVTTASAARHRCRLAMNAASPPPTLVADLDHQRRRRAGHENGQPDGDGGSGLEHEMSPNAAAGTRISAATNDRSITAGRSLRYVDDLAGYDAQRFGEYDQRHRQRRNEPEGVDDQVSHRGSLFAALASGRSTTTPARTSYAAVAREGIHLWTYFGGRARLPAVSMPAYGRRVLRRPERQSRSDLGPMAAGGRSR